MKSLTILLLAFFISYASSAQECLRYRKHEIGTSGCFAYFAVLPDPVDISQMDDGSTVYTTQAVCGPHTYGILMVKFKTPVSDSLKREAILINYMGVLKDMAGIKNCVGYGKGHTHSATPNAAGIIDYCEDANGNTWNLKGWINESCAAVLYISFSSSATDSPTQEVFFSGFRFQ